MERINDLELVGVATVDRRGSVPMLRNPLYSGTSLNVNCKDWSTLYREFSYPVRGVTGNCRCLAMGNELPVIPVSYTHLTLPTNREV